MQTNLPIKQGVWNTIKKKIKQKFPGSDRKVIQNWDFIMVFEDKYLKKIGEYFHKYEQQLKTKLFYKIVLNQNQQQIFVLLKINQQQVQNQAQRLKILKRKQKKSFGFDLSTVQKQIEIAQQNINRGLSDYLKWIRARLNKKNNKIFFQQQFSVFNKAKKQKYLQNDSNITYSQNPQNFFSPEQQLRAKYNFLLTFSIEPKQIQIHQNAKIFMLADIMTHDGFKQLIPIHKNSPYGSIMLGNLREYLSANEQTYFSFVAFLQRWLLLPSIIGVITILCNIFFQYTAEDSPADFIYALLIMVWSIVFVTKWEQRQKWTEAIQRTGYSQDWLQHQNIVDRQGCRIRQSRISGQNQYYIPFLQQVKRYVISLFICFSILLGTLYFMVLSLNARGFVDQNHKFLYFPMFSAWAKPGGLFDSGTSWGQIPNLLHVLITNIFDQKIYRPIAKKTTKYQQHFSHQTYENSIILKFFIYQYIITFADLFYIAFVRMDIIGLREQLLSLFFIDIIRRFTAELLIPKIMSMWRKHTITPINAQIQIQLKSQAILQVNKQDYQPFDDYLQIITNFGYLVMISSCFPLAPLLILIAHSIETLQDKYKIIHIFKRKLPKKYVGMGYWNKIVLFLCYTSIITNILLFAFSSHQIAVIFPKLYQSGKDIVLGNTQILDVIQQTATSVIDTVIDMTSTFQTSQIIQNIYEPFCRSPTVKSFTPPTQENQIKFVTILFVIQHIFLFIFYILRSILSEQQCEADILLERKIKKRSIKKLLNKQVLADIYGEKLIQPALRLSVKFIEDQPENAFNMFKVEQNQTTQSTFTDKKQ